MLNVRLLWMSRELILGLGLKRCLGLKWCDLMVTVMVQLLWTAHPANLKKYNLVTQSMNWPSLDCGCTEGPSSKDWWEVPELSVSLSNMVGLQEDIFMRGSETKPKPKSKTNSIKNGFSAGRSVWDAPEGPAAAVLAGRHVARAPQREDIIPGAWGHIQRLLGAGGLLRRGVAERQERALERALGLWEPWSKNKNEAKKKTKRFCKYILVQANKKQLCASKCREKMMEVNQFKCQKTRYWNVSDHEFDWQKVKINSSFSVKLPTITDPHWDADWALSSRLLPSAPSPAPPGSSSSPPGSHCCPGQGTETSCLNMQKKTKNKWRKTNLLQKHSTDLKLKINIHVYSLK